VNVASEADPVSLVPVGNPRMMGVPLNRASDVWKAFRDYAEARGEPLLSRAARMLLRGRVIEMGFPEEPVQSTQS